METASLVTTIVEGVQILRINVLLAKLMPGLLEPSVNVIRAISLTVMEIVF